MSDRHILAYILSKSTSQVGRSIVRAELEAIVKEVQPEEETRRNLYILETSDRDRLPHDFAWFTELLFMVVGTL